MPDDLGQVPEKPKKKLKKLNKRQKTFILEYVKTGNAAASAISAGYSKGSANIASDRLLGNVWISAEIERLQSINAKNLEIEHEITMKEIRARLVKIAFADVKNMVKDKRLGIELENTEGLKSVKVLTAVGKEMDSVTLTLHDSVKALQLLGESIGMFGEKKEDGDKSDSNLVKERVFELARKYKQTGSDK